MTKWFGAPKDLIALEARLEVCDMIRYATRNVDDASAIKAFINGLGSFYYDKCMSRKEEHEREIAKMVEDYEKERPILMPEGEQ